MARAHDKDNRPITTRTHGVLDYLIGIALIAAPWIFQFQDVSSAKWTAIIVGVAIIATSLMTNYELGLVRAIPMPMHLGADALAGIVLIASPWLFGFSDEGANAWVPHVLVGIGELGAAFITQRHPRDARRGTSVRNNRELRRAA
jgi:SPW repeat